MMPVQCVSAFKSLVDEHNAIPFTVQGTECGLAAEGAKTIAWELIGQLPARSAWDKARPTRVFVQVGGGALASGIAQGFHDVLGSDQNGGGVLAPYFPADSFGHEPQLHCVQVEGNQPLVRAMTRLQDEGITDVAEAAKDVHTYMTPWDNPSSVAYVSECTLAFLLLSTPVLPCVFTLLRVFSAGTGF